MKAFKLKLTFNLADWVTWIALHDMMGLIQSDEISDSEGLTPPSHKTQGILPAAFRLELCL